MFKINFHLVVYRYELILILIVLILTGSVVVSSKDRQQDIYQYKIALTFDDGPHPVFTDKIISILRKYDIHATFFLVGRLVMEYPYLVHYLSLAGHEIEGHSFTHRNLCVLKDEELVRELKITNDLISDITRQRCKFFRPPGGQYNSRVVNIAGSIGQEMILWSVFPKDHEEDDADVIIKKVLEQAKDKGVILLHSGRKSTLKALPGIIQKLHCQGYKFVTISDLIYTNGSSIEIAEWHKTSNKT